MFGLERITEVIAKRIRLTNPPSDGDSSPNSTPPDPGIQKPVSVREAQFSDFANVCALNLRLGQGPDSLENWYRLWSENPALERGVRATRIGWVLETSGGDIVGFLGSIPLSYELEGRNLRAAATCRFAVEASYRAFSHLLVVSFFRQKDVDLFLNTTATPAAAKIVKALNALPVPQPDYGKVLFWVLNYRRFSAEVLRKIGVWSPLVRPGSVLGALGLQTVQAIRGRGRRSGNSRISITESSVDEMGAEFERLLAEKRQEKPLLWAKRTPEIMRWHFNPPENRRLTRVFCCRVENELAGYLIVRSDPPGSQGLRRALLADLQIKEENPAILGSLLAAGVSAAKRAGCD